MASHERDHLAEYEPAEHEMVEQERLFAPLLEEARLGVRADFAARVMAALPPPRWAAQARPRHASLWLLPAAAVAGLAVLASTLGAFGSSASPNSGAVPEVLRTLGDLIATSLLAGSGLLAASWRGVGLVVREALGGSVLGLAVLAVVVLALNVLAWRAFVPRRATARRNDP